jgi:hypothetical protein
MGASHNGSGLEHLMLSKAASLVYHHVAGIASTVSQRARLDQILNDVAFAISNVAPIYVGDGVAHRRLTPLELLGCRFRRGATILATGNGREYRNPTLLRCDMLQAAAILRGAHINFRRPSQ